ncbi:MAG: allantoate amidohydrolase [Terracidiphilus sp.]|jgi:allantoate deiminase
MAIINPAQRAIAECLLIAAMTEEPGRITRRFLTSPMHAVHAHLRQRMESLSMTVHVDAAGNLRGFWQPAGATSRRLILGSHIDTVPNAGAFDGVLGVALAIEWVEIAQRHGLPLAIEVIAFSEEEGVRYGLPYLGSRAVADRFDASLLALTDAEGTTVDAALRAFGLDPGRIGEAVVTDEAVCFVEIHIEQGPLLEAEGLSVAAVTGIVGQTRLTLTFTGHANHAGTAPMHLRRDALAAAAEWISAVEALAQGTEGLAATVGRVTVEPNVGNVVAGVVRASFDVRHSHDATRRAAVEQLLDRASTIAARRGLTLERTGQLDQPAVPMDERLTALMGAAIEAAGYPLKTMPSGAGHDAIVMAGKLPTAMLFLRSPGGISHHPAESVREEDVEASLRVGREFLLRLADNVG